MTRLGSKLTRMLAVGALAITSLVVAAPAAQASPAYYPSGPQLNVPVSTVTSGGWSLCWSGTYDASATLATVLAACDMPYLLLAGGEVESSDYMLLAAGQRSSILNPTGANETTLNNGTYWYFNPSASMGFASVSDIHQNSADVQASGFYGGTAVDATTPYRMSWHVDGSSMDSGWRVGATVNLNSGSGYIRAIYEAPGVPPQPQLVVDALNVRVAMGQAVPQDVRVLGLVGTDKVTDVVLEYDGTTIWGDHFGPSTTPPTLAGTYSVLVKSYTLTAANASVYWQTKHSATLTVLWAPLPITDPKLVAPAANGDAPGTTVYGDNGATATGTAWSLSVTGAPRASTGGFLITDAGTVLTVTGSGYRPWSPIRIYLMSDPMQLASLYTDTQGAFTTMVTVPAVTGNHTLQVNGYSAAGLVRSSNVALFVGTTRSITDKFLFAKNSSELSTAVSSKIALMMNSIPVKPWRIHLTLTTSALALKGANAVVTQARVDNVANRIASSLRAAGVDVVVESTIWYQPGLAPRWEKQARWVHVDLNW